MKNGKLILLLITTMNCSLLSIAHDLEYEWVKNSDLALGRCVKTDQQGNVYVVGSFGDTVDFDPGIGVFTLISKGENDIFIQKLTENGDFIWAKSIGGQTSDQALFLAIDNDNNLCITGMFAGTADFDPGPSVFNLTEVGLGDIFVLKLDQNGNFIWAKAIGGSSSDFGNSIAVDDFNNVYVTGQYVDSADFDPGQGTYNLISNGAIDVFILKLTENGNFIWAKSIGGSNYDFGKGITIDPANNVCVIGYYFGEVDFDPNVGINNMLSVGCSNIFILKLDANGNFIWSRTTAGSISSFGSGITTDSYGNLYSVGEYYGTTNFNPGGTAYQATSNGSSDVFVLKLNSDGQFIWVNTYGGSNRDVGLSVETGSNDDIYIAGMYRSGNVDFDPGTGNLNLTYNGDKEIFIQRIDSNGNMTWTKSIGGPGSDVANSVWVNSIGEVYVTGQFQETVDFDPGIGIQNLTSVFSHFVLKLSADALGIEEKDVNKKVSVFPNPNSGSFSILSKIGILELFDMAGKKVAQVNLIEGLNTVSQNLKPGIYIWKVYNENIVETGELIVQ